MSSKLYPAQRAHGSPAQWWLIGGGAALVFATALMSMVVAQPRAVAVTPPDPTVLPVDADEQVQGPPEYRMVGYEIVDGQVMMRVSNSDPVGATSRLVALEDGYYDEGPQGYYWRLRPGH